MNRKPSTSQSQSRDTPERMIHLEPSEENIDRLLQDQDQGSEN